MVVFSVWLVSLVRYKNMTRYVHISMDHTNIRRSSSENSVCRSSTVTVIWLRTAHCIAPLLRAPRVKTLAHKLPWITFLRATFIAYFTVYLKMSSGYITFNYRMLSKQWIGKDGEETSGLILVIRLEGLRRTTKNFIQDGMSKTQDFKHTW
jgi:hypothetical protein